MRIGIDSIHTGQTIPRVAEAPAGRLRHRAGENAAGMKKAAARRGERPSCLSSLIQQDA